MNLDRIVFTEESFRFDRDGVLVACFAVPSLDLSSDMIRDLVFFFLDLSFFFALFGSVTIFVPVHWGHVFTVIIPLDDSPDVVPQSLCSQKAYPLESF